MFNELKVEKHLKDLKKWLIDCEYPESVIDGGIHCAEIQGPAPVKSNRDVIPFVTTNFSNLNFTNFVENCQNLLNNCKDEKLKQVFKENRVVLGLKNPKNLKRLLMPTTIPQKIDNGIFRCQRPNCKICKLYLQECKSFICSNGEQWDVRCQITCNSKLVLYYLKCNMCNYETYTGRTVDIRERTNNHITCCRHGDGTDKFDLHVHNCGIYNGNLNEPFFKMYAFMTVNCEQKLILYERMLHRKKLDTMNS